MEHMPKNHLGKHPPTQNNPLVVIGNEYWSTSKYQVKRKQYVYLGKKLKFAVLFILFFILFIILFCFTHVQQVIHFFVLKTILLAMLTESFLVSMTYFFLISFSDGNSPNRAISAITHENPYKIVLKS